MGESNQTMQDNPSCPSDPRENAHPYIIEEGLERIDWSAVHLWLSGSYWSPGITHERVLQGAQNSTLVLGMFKGDLQVGYLRVVSDTTRFAYLCDVWVETSHRGRGVGRRMVRYAMDHPNFCTVSWLLATADAHGVYASLGFGPLPEPQRYMVRKSMIP